MTHQELIDKGWTLIKLIGTPVGLIGIVETGYAVYTKDGKELKLPRTITQPGVIQHETIRYQRPNF